MGNCAAVCINNDGRHAKNQEIQSEAHGDNTKQGVKKASSKKSLHEGKAAANQSQESDNEEDDEYDDDFTAEAIKKKNDRGHKTISAEAYGKYNKKGDFKAKLIVKNEEQKKKIVERLDKAFMFSALDAKEKNIVIDAMQEKTFQPGEYVIKQGETGDHLYVVESGQLDCFKKFKPDQPDTFLKTYQPGESFGELALLYNCPRAASIIAKTNSVLWQLDRETFNNIVKDSAMKRRERYEEFLKKVDILKNMDPYERSKIADVLKTIKIHAGEYVIRQGDNGDTFYFIEEGEAVATKKETPDGTEKDVLSYKAGDFFGELALRTNAVRQASVKATTDLTLAVIDRDSFKRVLGPLDAVLESQAQKYVGYNPKK